jgi:hypothetical protein
LFNIAPPWSNEKSWDRLSKNLKKKKLVNEVFKGLENVNIFLGIQKVIHMCRTVCVLRAVHTLMKDLKGP